ncbi:hypothetical protein [Telluria beijingensis]|uniref:hypothetical protein n=1 Tax=Telluria beijingensis TaxID=3068633 RepID=UPI002795E3F8|nr:hypothetical protein [Massilia sp. REN29]
MFMHTAAPWRAAALLAAGLAAMPAIAQSTADDPAASVPETRYQAAHEQRAPVATTSTPDRNWQESNRTVAGQPGHAGHAHHAKPAAKEAPKHDHHEHHGHGDHH